MDELIALAEENDGLFTSKDAREAGILDSVLVRLTQRGRLERAARGVYRIAHYPQARFSQYREALLWAQSSHHEEHTIALSHETALLVYGISDANPSHVHITVPKLLRLRRESPKWIEVHRADLLASDMTVQEGLQVTTIARTIMDVLVSSARPEFAKQAVADARRQGLISKEEATRLNRSVTHFSRPKTETRVSTPKA
jgi:predicted transcriptional regulator of viral defense system